MKELETLIADWRRRMAHGGLHGADVLEELESHLREDIEAQVSAGIDGQDAFDRSVTHLGQADVLRREFDKLGGHARRRVKSALFTLAGIPQFQSTTNMNMTLAPSSLEPRWATYTKAAVFLAPAISLWTFSVIFLMPKLERICQEAGTRLPSVYQGTRFVADHPLFIVFLLVLPLALLEWRWHRWPQLRRASLGSFVFVLNATVMVLITAMLVFALLAAPGLMSKG